MSLNPAVLTWAMSSAATLKEHILALGPVGYWPLTETSGVTAYDLSGYSRHGTYSGSYTLAGRKGHATFAGGYVDIANNTAWTPGTTGGLTVFALDYLNGITGSRQIFVSKGAASQYEWQIEAEATSGRVVATWYGDAGGSIFQHEATASGHPTGDWTGWAFTLGNPATQGGRFPVYMNSGVALATSKPYSDPGVNPGNRSSVVRLAGRGDSAGQFYGALAHVAIFPYELTAEQLSSLMTAAAEEGY